MSTINVGNTSMEEVPGARFTYRRGEAAMLTRPFQGGQGQAISWANNYTIGVTTDTENSDFVLDSVEAVENGAQTDGKLTFYGDPLGYVSPPYSPSDPQVLSKTIWEPRSATLYTTQTADGAFIVNYFSPTITFKYCSSQVFTTPQLYQPNFLSNPTAITIMDFAFAAGNPNTATPNYALTGTWSYQVYAICTGFNADQKGSVYNYQETYAVLLQQPSMGNPPVQLTSSTPTIPSVQ